MCEIFCFGKTKLSTGVSLNATHLLSYLLMGVRAYKMTTGLCRWQNPVVGWHRETMPIITRYLL